MDVARTLSAPLRTGAQGVWDGDRGIPAAIGVTNYNVKESAIEESPWARFSVRALEVFRCGDQNMTWLGGGD